MPSDNQSTEGAFLALRSLTKRFDGHAAVNGISLEVKPGEFVSLLGPSGGGKTTLLHMIAGFTEPDAGDILIQGESVRDWPSHRRGAAMVFQSYALFPHLTVFENVAFGLRMRKVGDGEIRRQVSAALEEVRLQGLEKRYPRQLSGGQQQRVALARALILKPRLLLLDEPLSNLDPNLRRELRDNFREIHNQTRMTTLLVTHDIEEAFTTSDRVAILGNGRLEQFDTPQAIYTRPASAFVARFVGHRNIVQGTPVQKEARHFLAIEGAEALLETPGAASSYVIPMNQVRIATDETTPHGYAGMSGVLEKIEYLGALVRFQVKSGGATLVGECLDDQWSVSLQPGIATRACWPLHRMIDLPGAV